MQYPDLPKSLNFNLFQQWLFFSRPRNYSAKLRRRYGDVVTFRSRAMIAVMTLTPDGAQQILTANPDGYEAFYKREFTGLVGPGSLWVLDGSRHYDERRLLAPPFHAQRVRALGEAIKEIALLHVESWRPNQAVRAYELMLDISRDVILRTVFGLERGPDLDKAREVLAKLLPAVTPPIVFFHRLQERWFPPWARYVKARQEFTDFVEHHLARQRSSGHASQNVMGLMLAARNEDGTSMSTEAIRDQLLTILLAGHETTAVALAWALYELGRNPEVLKRLREELSALGPNPDPDTIAKQRYLGAVCNEILRLHTILTELVRITRVPSQILGYHIPVGIAVGVSISAIHQDAQLYPEPDRFQPQRFIERKYNMFEFLPFGGGDRRCLGAALSDYEMRIVLATIVMSWEFKLNGNEQEIRHNISTGPKHGVRMRLIRRRQE